MSDPARDFAKALDRAVDAARREATRRVRRAGMVALRRIVVRTPVDTGCCRANWRVAFGEIDRTFDARVADKSGAASISKSSALLTSATLGTDLFISNSTPYCGALECGSSRQNRLGMVRITADDVKALIERGAL